MSAAAEIDLDELALRARSGDRQAASLLLAQVRPRLKRMVAVRTDDRFSARFDQSDVVQEALAEAAVQLPAYLAEPSLPFYPWVRAIAERKLIDYCRRHGAARRNVKREVMTAQGKLGLSDRSGCQLASLIVSPGSSPSAALSRHETQELVRQALDSMPDADREVLVLYHLEQLTLPEVAAVLGMSVESVKSRRRRAVLRLAKLLSKALDV